MTDFGTLALGSQVAQAGAGVANGVTQSNAIRAQASYDRAAAEENAKLIDRQAQDAADRGAQDVTLIGNRGKQIIGTQRARLAAQGIDVTSGSALDVQTDAAVMSEMDKLTAKNNAAREVYGYRSQASAVRSGASLQAMGARNRARSTLLESYISGSKDIMLGAYYYDQMKGLNKDSAADRKKAADFATLKASDPYQKR